MNYTMFKQGGQKVEGLMQQTKPQAPPQWLPYIEMESVDASAKKDGEPGAKILMPPMDIPTVGRLAVFVEPQGAAVGVFQSERK
jgi:predicted enzyme related to lactoylglutathione lyase